MGHAMAETPAGVARALLYIVRASPTFFHQSINHSYIPYLSSLITSVVVASLSFPLSLKSLPGEFYLGAKFIQLPTY